MDIRLPEGFELKNTFMGPKFEDGVDMLLDYCSKCKKEPRCEINYSLRYAMGNNCLFWPDSFIAVDIFEDPINNLPKTKVFCRDYKKNPKQLLIPGIMPLYSEGVARLLTVLEKEKKESQQLRDLILSTNSG